MHYQEILDWSKQPLPSDAKDEFLALYQVTVQDLIFFKTQQWNAANYTLLAIVALAGIPELADKPISGWASSILAVLVLAVGAAGVNEISSLSDSILRRRDRLRLVYLKMSPEFRIVVGEPLEPRSRTFTRTTSVVLLNVVAVGSLLAMWVITR